MSAIAYIVGVLLTLLSLLCFLASIICLVISAVYYFTADDAWSMLKIAFNCLLGSAILFVSASIARDIHVQLIGNGKNNGNDKSD